MVAKIAVLIPAYNESKTIGEVVKNYPTTIEVLENEGIHCVGCHTPFDKPLAKAFFEKNLTTDQIREIIQRMPSSPSLYPFLY